MEVYIQECHADILETYGTIPIAFRVDSVFEVKPVDGGLGGLLMEERPVSEPYIKDYDAIPNEGPTQWAKRFDLFNWGFSLVLVDDTPVGATAVAFRTPGVHMLEGRDDLAVLWDIRVHPEWRGRSIGSTLFAHAAAWARARACTQLKIETQNVNIPACKFYAAQGCRLGAIIRHGYTHPEVAHEVMLLWYLDL